MKYINNNQDIPSTDIAPGVAQEKAGAALRSCLERFERAVIGGKNVLIPPPVATPASYRFVGRENELFQLAAALEAGLNPVVISDAGQGKTSSAIRVAQTLGRPLYLVHGHEDLHAENLLVELLPTADGFEYIVQPLLAAILSGGVAAIDEINRLNEAALASLHGLLDGRRTVNSSLLGMRIEAHPDFRFFGLANPFTTPLSPAADQRLRPAFRWENYSIDELLSIILETEGLGTSTLDNAFKAALARQHPPLSLRSSLTVLRFARSLQGRDPGAKPDWCVATAMATVSGTSLTLSGEGGPFDA